MKRFLLLLPLAASVAFAQPPRTLPGSIGAIAIPFSMAQDGTATVALYNKDGRLIRPLAQSVPLAKGAYVARWDGLDLWGNALPAGSEVQAKIITGPGLRAKYEFGIASPNKTPWPTRPFGDGDAMRAGGWLGDHGTGTAALAVGERIYLSSFMAEHGHTIIYCNLDGEKMWGRGGLDGWKGPRLMASDGQSIFGVVEKNKLYRMDLSGENSAKLADSGEDEIVGFAAREGKIYLSLKNHEVFASLVKPLVGGRDFDYDKCLPKPSNDKVYNRNINGREQFATTFYDGGHPQTGIAPGALNESSAGIVAKFTKPMALGTLLVERLAAPLEAEFYFVPQGANFAPPQPGAAPGDGWQLLGKSDLARRVNTVTAPRELAADALYIRLLSKTPLDAKKWPRLTMCRILPKRLTRADEGATVVTPAPNAANAAPGDAAWSFRSAEPITDENPAPVLLDLKKPTAFDALILHNSVAEAVGIDAWTGNGAPDAKAAAGWSEITVYKAGSGNVEGSLAASQNSNDQRVSLTQTVTTRALRLRLLAGMGAGRWANPMNKADAGRAEAADVALLKLSEARPQVAEMLLQTRDGKSGEVLSETRDASANITAMSFAPDGTLYSLVDNKLCRTAWPTTAGAAAKHTVLSDKELQTPTCLGISPDGARVAVGDFAAKALFVFDKTGKVTTKIGTGAGRVKGPWNPHTIDQPSGVAIDKNGKIWVVEKTYTPKRITRYSADGKAEKEFFGPPHYGGGGYLAPDLKSFWYEACEYEIDFAAGTSRLKYLNDVLNDPDSPALDKSSYSYTKIGRPIYYKGHRYAVGDVGTQFNEGFVVCLFDEGQTSWKPAAVLGNAQGNVFLVGAHRAWRTHWLKQDLSDASFIWCDLNGDGKGQIDEVQVFKNKDVLPEGKPFNAPYWGTLSGFDLTFWSSSARLAPSRFTAQGVPVYEKKDIQPFSYEKLAPVYHGNIIANQSAKPGYGGFSLVARDGTLALEGQPYIVKPDLSIVGGPVTEKPSEYIPLILGTRLDNPMTFVGSAATKSVGEVALINGDNGNWFLWSIPHAVVLGEIFTGHSGSFGGLTNPTRGQDVTGYKQDWETFFGYFTKATNGNYYAVAGRGHFGLFKVEGVDEIQVATQTVRVSPESLTVNTPLRARLAAADKAAREAKRGKRELKVQTLAKRAAAFQLDGDLKEWGDAKNFQKISEDGKLAFDAAWNDEFLTLAYKGNTATANNSADWKYIFKTGFAFDLMIRSDPTASGETPAKGDRRIVFSHHKNQWVAVLYDYVAPGAKPGDAVDYTSPVTSTRVDRVTLLPADAVKIAFRETAPNDWSAEVQLRWAALGITPTSGQKLRADFGILTPDTGGLQADKRTYWSNPNTNHVADLAVESQIHPGSWGTLTLQGP